MHATPIHCIGGCQDQSYETTLSGAAVTTDKDLAPSYMERMVVAHTLTRGNEYMAGTVVESSFYATHYRPQAPLKSVTRLPPAMRVEIERALADLCIVIKSNVETTIEKHQIKWTNTLQSQIVRAVKSTFQGHVTSKVFQLE